MFHYSHDRWILVYIHITIFECYSVILNELRVYLSSSQLDTTQNQDLGAAWDPVECGEGGSGIDIELVTGMVHYNGIAGRFE